MDINKIELLDDFLAGKLTKDQAKTVQDLASTDSSFGNELNQQQEIVEGISEFRKSQLKDRLNNVSVNQGNSSTWTTKIAIAASVVAAIGVGVSLNSTSENETVVAVEKEEVQVEAIQEEAVVEEIVEVEEVVELTNDASVVAEEETEEVVDTKPAVVPAAVINLPTVVSHENEISLDEDVSADASALGNDSNTSDVATSIVAEYVKGRFHYKYQDSNVLVQIADYTNESQATLIHYADSKQVYMEYMGKFYELLMSNDWASLEKAELTDQKLINQLKAKLK